MRRLLTPAARPRADPGRALRLTGWRAGERAEEPSAQPVAVLSARSVSRAPGAGVGCTREK